MNRLWTRVFVVAACILILLFFSNDFGIIDIQQTAIVVAVGIDQSETDENKYDVTAQIAMPVSSGTSGAEAACQITIRDSSTIGEAIAKINSQTGWFPTLVYCNLVLFGEATTNRDVFDALDYFLRSNYVPDTALVAVVGGRCDEILSSQSPINDMSSAAITKTLSSEAQKSGTVSVKNLRDFSKEYFSPSQSGYLPFIETKEAGEEGGGENEQGGGESQAAATFSLPYSAGFENTLARLKKLNFHRWSFWHSPLPVSAEGNSQGGEKGGKSASKIFQASKTALFYRGKLVGKLDPDETLALNLATAHTSIATMSVKVDEEGQDIFYVLQLEEKKHDKKLEVKEDFAKFTITVECSCQITDASRSKSIENITKTQMVQKKILRAAEKHLTEKLDSIFKKSIESGCDVFCVQQILYRRSFRNYERLKDNILQTVYPVYNVKFETFK